MVVSYYHLNMEWWQNPFWLPAGRPDLIFEVWQGRLGMVISNYHIIFGIFGETRIGDLRAVQTLFSRFG